VRPKYPKTSVDRERSTAEGEDKGGARWRRSGGGVENKRTAHFRG